MEQNEKKELIAKIEQLEKELKKTKQELKKEKENISSYSTRDEDWYGFKETMRPSDWKKEPEGYGYKESMPWNSSTRDKDDDYLNPYFR